MEPQAKKAKVDTQEMRIHLWAVPRAISTATMYSFAQRPDTTVLDEPLYAHHLTQETHLDRPYKDKLMAEQKHDGNEVIRDIMGPAKTPIVFCKHMSKHIVNLNLDFMFDPRSRHIVLVRDPIDQLSSWNNDSGLEATIEELSIIDQVRVFSTLRRKGIDPIVVDSEILQRSPRGVLTELCRRLNIPFEESMLKWEAGPKPYDGCWAYHWYKSANKSTGFQAPGIQRCFPRNLYPLLQEAQPIYNMMREHAIGFKVPNISTASGASSMQVAPLPDERNRQLISFVGGRLVNRDLARVSVFDSSVQAGDSVWKSVRVYHGKVFMLYEQIQRLRDAAKKLCFEDIPSADYIQEAVFRTFAANGMVDESCARIILSRGEKTTSSMSPMFNAYGTTVVVLAEWKKVENTSGAKHGLIEEQRSSTNSMLYSNNLVERILPKIQASNANVNDVIVLDQNGSLAESTSGNVFCVKNGTLITPQKDSCNDGVVRELVLQIASGANIEVEECAVSPDEVYAADEVFTADVVHEIRPVIEIEGRTIGKGEIGEVTKKLQKGYRDYTLTCDDVLVKIPCRS